MREDLLPLVRSGVWLYDGTVPVRLRIVESPETHGTGNDEDEKSVRENHPIRCFFLMYEAAGSPGRFSTVMPSFPTLEAAVAHAEKVFSGVRWDW